MTRIRRFQRARRRPLRALAALVVTGAVCSLASGGAAFLLFGEKWNDPAFGTPAVLGWGFMEDGTGVSPGFSIGCCGPGSGLLGTSQIGQLRTQVDAVHGAGAFDAAIERAFETWAAVADVRFVGPLADTGLPINDPEAGIPAIRIGAFTFDPAHSIDSGAVGFSPPPNGGTLAGDVLFNLSKAFQIAPGEEDVTPVDRGIGEDLEGLFAHEVGHALGLDHPIPGAPDTDVMALMYTGPGCCQAINRQPAQDDIDGIQTLYGPPLPHGDALPVLNAGFEDPPNFIPGGFKRDEPIPGWRILDPAGLFDLPGNDYGTSWPVTPDDFLTGAPQGRQTAYFLMDAANGPGEVGMEQEVPALLEPDHRYTLQVEVGNFGALFFDGFPDYRVELRAGDTLLASEGDQSPGEGEFATSQIEIAPRDAAAGQCEPIRIRLLHENSGPGFELDYDDVRLAATPIDVQTLQWSAGDAEGSVAGHASYDTGAGASQAVPSRASVSIDTASGDLAELAGLDLTGSVVEGSRAGRRSASGSAPGRK